MKKWPIKLLGGHETLNEAELHIAEYSQGFRDGYAKGYETGKDFTHHIQQIYKIETKPAPEIPVKKKRKPNKKKK